MPGVIPSLGANGAVPAMWNAIIQQINGIGAVAAGAATNPSRQALDQYQNTSAVQGPLNQVVTIGNGYQQLGVLVGTGLTGYGTATPSAFAQTTITTTKGSTVATVASATGFVNGMMIGASTPAGAAAITPGTWFTISGTTVNLSQPALLSGAALYCCAASWAAASSVKVAAPSAPLPVVSMVGPSSGPHGGGTTVLISGSGFTGATAVKFGTTAATGVTVVSDTQLVCTSPAFAGWTVPVAVDVTVVTPNGTSATSSADQYTYAT